MKFAMRLGRRKKNGIYFVEIEGKRTSLGTRDKVEATRLYNKIKKEALKGKLAFLTGTSKITLGEFKEKYLEWAKSAEVKSTYRADKLALQKLTKQAGESIRLDKIDIFHLDKMVASCLEQGLSKNSINNYIRHARRVMNKAVDWRYISRNTLSEKKELKVDKSPPSFLHKDSIPEFLGKVTDIDVRRMIVAYIATGRRRAELVGLRWKDINWETKTYHIGKSKNHLSRDYPINSVFETVLKSLPRSSEWVFPRFRHPDTISHLVKDALVAGGMGHLHLHHLRHTFASLQIMQGRSLKTVQGLLGHIDYQSTLVYAHLTDEFLQENAEIQLGPIDLGN